MQNLSISQVFFLCHELDFYDVTTSVANFKPSVRKRNHHPFMLVYWLW